MSVQSSHLQRIHREARIEPTRGVVVTPLRNSVVQVSRMVSEPIDRGIVPMPVDDALILTYQFQALPDVNIWLNGRHHLKKAMGVDCFSLVNLGIDTHVEFNMPFDSLEMVFQRRELKAMAEERGADGGTSLAIEGLGRANNDSVISALAGALVPAFAHPGEADPLYVEHVALAMISYLAETYGGLAPAQPVRGGLAPWQLRRAKEFMAWRKDGDTSLEELARQCGLSRSHFARAFRQSTGRPPFRWLLEHRLERAQDLMLETDAPLAEIADACGFSDPSHLSRSFSAAFGMSPSAWRRRRRS